MRATTTVLTVLSALVLCTGAPAARAQSAQAATADTAAEAWSAKPVGAYTLAMVLPERTMDVDLTIADSSGTLTAMFWPVGDNDGHQMHVAVQGTELVLTADSPRGAVRIVLQRRGQRLSGAWTLGEEHGTLTGAVKAAG